MNEGKESRMASFPPYVEPLSLSLVEWDDHVENIECTVLPQGRRSTMKMKIMKLGQKLRMKRRYERTFYRDVREREKD